VGDVLREQTPKQLYVVRGKLYELLTNCIPPEVIFRHLTFELLRKLDDELRHKVWRCKVPVLLPHDHACTALLDSTSQCISGTWGPCAEHIMLCLVWQVALFAAQFEHRLQQGSKPIFHLEVHVDAAGGLAVVCSCVEIAILVTI
jgi:hypothetical protein